MRTQKTGQSVEETLCMDSYAFLVWELPCVLQAVKVLEENIFKAVCGDVRINLPPSSPLHKWCQEHSFYHLFIVLTQCKQFIYTLRQF